MSYGCHRRNRSTNPSYCKPTKSLRIFFGFNVCMSPQDLKDSFKKYGPIDSVRVIEDKITRKSRGFGFVNFKNIEDAEKAKNNSVDLVMNDRKLQVNFSLPQRPYIPISERNTKLNSSERERFADPEPSKCLCVFGLGIHTTVKDLKLIFKKYGSIDNLAIIKDKVTRESRGYAFIYFHNLNDAKKAKKDCAELVIEGREIKVSYSFTSQPNDPNRNKRQPIISCGDGRSAKTGEEEGRCSRIEEKSFRMSDGNGGYQSTSPRDYKRYDNDHERRIREVDFKISQQPQIATHGIYMGHPTRNLGGGYGGGSSRNGDSERFFSGSSSNRYRSASPRCYKRHHGDYKDQQIRSVRYDGGDGYKNRGEEYRHHNHYDDYDKSPSGHKRYYEIQHLRSVNYDDYKDHSEEYERRHQCDSYDTRGYNRPSDSSNTRGYNRPSDGYNAGGHNLSSSSSYNEYDGYDTRDYDRRTSSFYDDYVDYYKRDHDRPTSSCCDQSFPSSADPSSVDPWSVRPQAQS